MYFFQNQNWVNCWEKSQGKGHKIFTISTNKLSCFVYQYVWHGEKLWYTGKGPTYTNNLLKDEELTKADFIEFLIKLQVEASSENVLNISCDFDDEICEELQINNENIEEILKQSVIQNNLKKLNYKVKRVDKSIQYKQAAYMNLDFISQEIVDLEKIDGLGEKVGEKLKEIFKIRFDKKTRNELNKAVSNYIEGAVTVKVGNGDALFEDFWKIHEQTAKFQGFNTNSKQYSKNMAGQDFCLILVAYDNNNNPCAGWFGAKIDNTCLHLLGGNDEYSKKFKVQNLLHIMAWINAKKSNCNIYDFGGYDQNNGYGSYKDKFEPQIRTFIGPINIVLKPLKYSFIEMKRKLGQKVLSLIKRH